MSGHDLGPNRIYYGRQMPKRIPNIKGETSRTLKDIAKMRRLWDESLPTSKIAAEMGLGWTKNAVIGLARRQNFPPRPNPAHPHQHDQSKDDLIRTMFATGETWVAIGAAVFLTPNGARMRGIRLGVTHVRARLEWTTTEDDLIRSMRRDRKSWDQIAEVLGVSMDTTRRRGIKIGASLAPVTAASSPTPGAAADGPRLPMPAGSSVSWGCISDQPWPGVIQP